MPSNAKLMHQIPISYIYRYLPTHLFLEYRHEFFSRNSFASLTFVARYGLPPRSGWFSIMSVRWFFRIFSFVRAPSLLTHTDQPPTHLSLSSSQYPILLSPVFLSCDLGREWRTVTAELEQLPSYSSLARIHLYKTPFRICLLHLLLSGGGRLGLLFPRFC